MLVPRPAIHVGLWPAITRRQSPPSPLARQTSLAAVEYAASGLVRSRPEARRHYRTSTSHVGAPDSRGGRSASARRSAFPCWRSRERLSPSQRREHLVERHVALDCRERGLHRRCHVLVQRVRVLEHPVEEIAVLQRADHVCKRSHVAVAHDRKLRDRVLLHDVDRLADLLVRGDRDSAGTSISSGASTRSSSSTVGAGTRRSTKPCSSIQLSS